MSQTGFSVINRAKDVCVNGHHFTEENTYTKSNGNRDCRACIRNRVAAYRAANKDKIRIRDAAWRAANPERVKSSKDAWYAANPEKAKATSAAWRAANPEAVRVQCQNRRSRKREAGGKLSSGLTGKLFKLQKGKCACGCKQPLGDDHHLDHIMPLVLGGTNTDDNIQLLTATRNLQKSAKHPVDFMQQRGFLL